MTNKNTLGESIAWIRENRGMSQQDLADDLQCSRAYISNIENGIRKPNHTTLKNIAEALAVEMEELSS